MKKKQPASAMPMRNIVVFLALSWLTACQSQQSNTQPFNDDATGNSPQGDLKGDMLVPPVPPALNVRAVPGALVFDWKTPEEQALSEGGAITSESPNITTTLYRVAAGVESVQFQTQRIATTRYVMDTVANGVDWLAWQYILEHCTPDNCVRSFAQSITHLQNVASRTLGQQQPAALAGFGSSVVSAANGKVLFTGVPGAAVDDVAAAGEIAVHFRLDGSWQAADSIALDLPQENQALGSWLDASADGDILAANTLSTRGDDSNEIQVFERFGEQWIQTTTIQAPEGARFGEKFLLSRDGQTLFISSDQTSDSATVATIQIYQRVSTQWQLQQTLIPADSGPFESSKLSLAASADGATLILGIAGNRVLQVYQREAGSYALAQQIGAPEPFLQVGSADLAIDDNATVLAVGWRQSTIATADDYIRAKSPQSIVQILVQDENGQWVHSDRLYPSAINGQEAPMHIAMSADGEVISVAVLADQQSSFADTMITTFELPVDTGASDAPWQIRSVVSNPAESDNRFGASLNLSDDGEVLFVGAPDSTDRGVFAAGQVYWY